MRGRSLLVLPLFLASAAASFLLFDRGASASGPVTPAAPGEPTYVLSNFDLRPPSAPGTVPVTFDMAWADETFPGKARCEVEVSDANGTVVGTVQFAATALEPGPTRTGPVAVPLAGGDPASATGVCAAGERPPAGARYLLSGVRVPSEGTPRIEAQATWKDGLSPGDQACTATLAMSDGTTRTYHFTLAAPDGQLVTVLLTPELSTAVGADATCGPLTGERP
jgi:hypothetical protein